MQAHFKLSTPTHPEKEAMETLFESVVASRGELQVFNRVMVQVIRKLEAESHVDLKALLGFHTGVNKAARRVLG